jgi:hypothetical protein
MSTSAISQAKQPASDSWLLTDGEVETVVRNPEWGLLVDTPVVFAHIPNHSLERRLERIEGGSITGRDALVLFCDGIHYRGIFSYDKVWYVFDSLDQPDHATDLTDVMKQHTPHHQIVHIRLKVQSDSVNCGVWLLWAIGHWLEYMDFWVLDNGVGMFDAFLWQKASDQSLSSLTTESDQESVKLNEDFVHKLKREFREKWIPRSECPIAAAARRKAELVRERDERQAAGNQPVGGESKKTPVDLRDDDSQRTQSLTEGAVEFSKRLYIPKLNRPTRNNP